MAVNLTAKIIEMLKMAGIDYSKMAGKIDPNKVKQLVTKTQKTATKPKLIDALNKEKATFSDALKIFEDEAQYISQMNEMELANFANNLDDYFKVGGKKKNIESNVVTTEGSPVVGKQLEKLSERKGAKGEVDTGSLEGSMQGLMSLVDELKGISPKLRNQMDRDELAKFIQKMRGKKFTNEEIKWVREYLDDNYSLGFAKEKATGMQYGKNLGAKSKEEFEFVNEYVDNLNTTSPKKFKEMYGNVKNVNMDISNIIDSKLEKHFKKKYKWDDTKTDGGLDDKTYELYESELFDTQKEFGNFHTVYDGGRDAFGMRKGRSWENHPNNYLDEASAKFESITGEGLNVDFLKSYTDDVLSKYPEPEKFQYGGQVIKGPDLGSTAHGSSELASRQRVLQPGGQMTTSTGLNYLLGEDDNNRIPFNDGLLVPPKKPFQGLFHTEVGGPVITKDDSEFEAVVDRWSQFARQKGEGPEGVERNKSFALENIVRIGREQGYEDDEIKEIILRINKKADGGRISFQGGGSDASEDSFKTPSAHGMSPMEAQARGLGVEHHGSTTSWNKHAGNTGGGNDNNNIVTPPESKKDPHDTAIDYIDKANQGWKAWNMLNAGSIGGAVKAAMGFNPYAWAGAGLIGLDKRRKLKKMKEEELKDSLMYADGGRIGFSLGGMGRRGFLKFLGGTAAGIAAMKTGLVKLLGGKSAPEVKKVIDEVVVNNKSGAPEWFQPLVNKILREGKDANITYGERQIGKVMDTPSGKVDVVYKMDTGEVELSFVGKDTALGEQVDLVYKPGQVIEEGKFAGKKEGDEFIASESVPEGNVSSFGEDVDYSIDVGVKEADNVGELASDLSELKTFATGEKQTIKEIVEGIKKKKTRAKMEGSGIDYITETQGDIPYASGGLAGMLGE